VCDKKKRYVILACRRQVNNSSHVDNKEYCNFPWLLKSFTKIILWTKSMALIEGDLLSKASNPYSKTATQNFSIIDRVS